MLTPVNPFFRLKIVGQIMERSWPDHHAHRKDLVQLLASNISLKKHDINNIQSGPVQ